MRIVQCSREPDELRQVRRFWYQVYCEERGILLEQADHVRRELADPLDLQGNIFVGRDDAGAVCGTVMTSYSRDGDLAGYEAFYEMSRLGDSHPSSSSITTKLMVSKSCRRTPLAVMLITATFRKCIADGITCSVIDCNVPLVSFFTGLGCVPHAGWKKHRAFGDVCVMVIRPYDDARHIHAIGSPLAKYLPVNQETACEQL